METVFINSASVGVIISLLGYGAGIALKKKTRLGICNPLLISILLCPASFMHRVHNSAVSFPGQEFATFLSQTGLYSA